MARRSAPSAQRPLDRLLPTALALVLGVGTLSAALGGIVSDALIGRPSAASGVGFVLMLPLAIFAAIVGFAAGYGMGAWLKQRGFNPQVAIRPYRIVMALVLGVATVIGATFGARPVLRHERLFEPRVRAGAGAMTIEESRPDGCREVLSTFGEVSATWTRDGRVTLSRPDGAVVGDADLSRYETLRGVHAAGARLPGGEAAFAILVSFTRSDRHLLMIFDGDGKPVYEEMLAGAARGEKPLQACSSESGDSFVVELEGRPVTYRPR